MEQSHPIFPRIPDTTTELNKHAGEKKTRPLKNLRIFNAYNNSCLEAIDS